MKKIFCMLGLACLLFGMPVSLHAQKLSDEQVISLVKEQKAAGKSDKEIGQMLVARGVTREQLERIKADYEEKQGNSNQGGSAIGTDESRSRRSIESSFTETMAGSLDLIGEPRRPSGIAARYYCSPDGLRA